VGPGEVVKTPPADLHVVQPGRSRLTFAFASMKPKNFFSTWARQRNAIWGEVVPDICATASVAASYDNMEIDSYASNPAPSTVENPGEESGAGPCDSTSELSASVKKLTVVDSQSARCSERASEEIPVKRVGPAHAVQVSSESWTQVSITPARFSVAYLRRRFSVTGRFSGKVKMMKEAPEAMKIAEASEANSGKMAEEQAAAAAAVKKNVKGNDEARRPKRSSDLE